SALDVGPPNAGYLPNAPNTSSAKGRREASFQELDVDDPGTPVIGDVVPRPVEKDARPVAKADQLHEMKHEPHDPSQKPSKSHAPELGDCGVAADRRHCAGIAVLERLDRPAFD